MALPDYVTAQLEQESGGLPDYVKSAAAESTAMPEQQPQPIQAQPAPPKIDSRAINDIISEHYRMGALNPKQQEAADELARRGLLNLAQDVGPVEAALIGTGKGFMNVARGLGIADKPLPEDIAGYEALKKERPYTTGAGEIVGEAAPFVPLGMGVGNIGKTGARVLASGLASGAEGAIVSEGTGGDALAGGVIGAGVGVGAEILFPVIGKMGRKLYQKAFGKAPVGAMLDATGKPTAQLTEALNKAGLDFSDLTDEAVDLISTQGDTFDPTQLARKKFLEAQGITPTRAQVTREAADFQAQQEAAKTSGRLRNALEVQDAALTTRFDNAIIETGGKASSPTVSVVDKVVDKATALDRQISDLYKVARESAPGEKNVKLNNLVDLLQKYAPANRRTGGNIEAIVGELKDAGIISKSKKGLKVSGLADVETAENVRKVMNSLYDPQNPYGNMILRELKNSLDDDVFKATGDDVFKAARSAKANFESELSRAKISKFDSRNSNLVRDILENKIDPDQFTDKVVMGKNWRADDINQLKKYVGDGPEWNDMKADVLNRIKERSFIGPEDANGFMTLSRSRLENTLDKIGEKKLKTIFNDNEVKFLKDILKVSKMREPVRGTALGRGPSAQAIASLEAKLKDLPVLGNLVKAINVDVSGRVALKGTPQKIASSVGRKEIPGATTAMATSTAVPTAYLSEGEY